MASSSNWRVNHSRSHSSPTPLLHLLRPIQTSFDLVADPVPADHHHHHRPVIGRQVTAPSANSSGSSVSNFQPLHFAGLTLLDGGSGRLRKLKFPGYIPLSRYFISPSSDPTTPTNIVAGDQKNNIGNSIVVGGDSNDSNNIRGNHNLVSQTSNLSGSTQIDDENGIPDTQTDQSQTDGPADTYSDMEESPIAIVGDPEPLMTQDLLNFYKNRLHELEQSTQAELLERISVLRGFLLEHHDATNRLEKQLHELQDENTALSNELEEGVKFRVEVIALTKENELLKEKIGTLSDPRSSPIRIDPTPIPSPDPSATGSAHSKELEHYDRIQTHYEDLIQELLHKFRDLQVARESERSLANQNIDQLNDRCRRLETAVSDSLKDIIQERTKRVDLEERLKETEEELNVSVFEMQSQLDIFEKHMNETRNSPGPLETVEEEVIPEDFFDDVPDVNDGLNSKMSKCKSLSPILGFHDQGVQTQETEDETILHLRKQLEELLHERQAEEEILKSKKAEFETAYAQLAEYLEKAKASEGEHVHLKAECEELRCQVDELLEQHDFDQEDILAKQVELDATLRKLEEVIKQHELDKELLNQADTENFDLQNRVDNITASTSPTGNPEIRELKSQLEQLDKQHQADTETITKTSVEAQNLRLQLEELVTQHEADVETALQAESTIKTLREETLQLSSTSILNTKLTSDLESLQSQLTTLRSYNTTLEAEKTRKEGDVKLLREQLQNLLQSRSSKDSEAGKWREEAEHIRKRYGELLADRKREEEFRQENFMELEAVRQRLHDVMRIKEQEHLLHQRDIDSLRRKDEENQKQLGDVSTKLVAMVEEMNRRNEIMKELNETIATLKLADEASSAVIQEAKTQIAESEREIESVRKRMETEADTANERIKVLEEQAILSGENVANETMRLEKQINALEEQLHLAEEKAIQEVISLKDQIKALEDEITVVNDDAIETITGLEAYTAKVEHDIESVKQEAATKISIAEQQLKRLEDQLIASDAKSSTTIALANERVSVLERQVKAYESLKRHKAQDEADLLNLKANVIKVERIALQFLPLEDSGMLNAIDELKRSHLETQQKHKKRRKKEQMMAERSKMEL